MKSASGLISHLISVILIASLIRLVRCFTLPTCCPNGHILVDITGSNPGYFRYFKCALQRDDRVGIDGYNIETSLKNNIPKCDHIVAEKITGLVPLGPESCVGLMEGHYYILMCPFRPVEVASEVSVVKKCCPKHWAYNLNEKKCEKLSPSAAAIGGSNFGHLFGEPTILHSGNLECLSSSVVVDYRSGDFNVSFENGELIVDRTSAFGTNAFCLESIMMMDGNESAVMVSMMDSVVGGAGDIGVAVAQPAKERQIGDQFLIRTCRTAAICDRIPCVRRCCRFDERLVRRNGSVLCIPDPKDLQIDFYDLGLSGIVGNLTGVDVKVFGVLQMQKCTKYPLHPEYSELDAYYFHYKDGSMYLPAEKIYYKNSDYCVQNAISGYGNQVEAFICFDSSDKGLVKFTIYSIGLMISSVFLGLTIIVYICVPKLLNLPGKNLICFSFSMMSAYIGLFLIQHSSLQFTICYPLAFFIYFSFMATFSWLNVMCFDIWWSFGSSKGTRNVNGYGDKHRFLLYSIFAWAVPCIFTTITLCVDYFKLVNDYFHPNIGEGRCWFSQTSSPPHLLFFLTPIAVLIITNFILFILTLRYCNRVKREIFRMQSSSSEKKTLKKRFISDKARFAMNTKLFIVMGVSWLLEVISTILYEFEAVWYVSDFFNVLQGVFVFLIFVFKRRVWAAVAQRLGIGKKNAFRLGNTMPTTPSTFVTSTNDLRKMKSIDNLPLSPLRSPRSPKSMHEFKL